ncbi:hypothetical protein M422DRAFT_264748 [Sphaerobolus stellatus SS14]|uniref:Chitin synthase export chaperone n=1 Tax=Sphaerobolus stellatus (strain SS14) TaxID=990650 RepID=A0A0C9UF30_SPHS4|nr:hypothetical protein M422DRAFT_264748 [Sphaerobolus stellatus SS14]
MNAIPRPPLHLNSLLPALLAALILPTLFVHPDPICDSNMIKCEFDTCYDKRHNSDWIPDAFSCPPKAIWVWLAVGGHLDALLFSLVRGRILRRIDCGNRPLIIWLLEMFFVFNLILLDIAASLQAVWGFPGLYVLPKVYKVRYIVMFILNVAGLWDNWVNLGSATDARELCRKAEDQERDKEGMAKEMQECD